MIQTILTNTRAHLEKAKETYWQHAVFASAFAFQCFKASLMAFVHALVPGLFETDAGKIVRMLDKKLDEARGRNQDRG